MEDYLNLSALYYDISKPIGKSLDGDLEFYESHLTNQMKILEAGVGTGRLLIPYLKKGYNIDGIDLSLEMIKKCQDNCVHHNVSPRLFHGSVVTYDFDRSYDAIIVPTGTFCLFPDIKNVLQNLRDSLANNGFVMFDLIFPNNFKENKTFTYSLDVNNSDKLPLHDNHYEINWITQQTTELLTYEYWKSGKLIESELQTFVINWYGINEIVQILKEVGFKDIQLFGDYTEYKTGFKYDIITLKAYK